MKRNVSGVMIILLFAAWGCATSSLLKKSEELVTIERHEILAVGNIKPNEKIPTQYESYTFFLFPDRKWLKESTPRTLHEMYDEFRNFGNAIGKKNLAIWFFNKKGDPDIRRSSEFAGIFNLDTDSGPYILYVEPKRPLVVNIVRQHGSNVIEEKVSLFELKSVSEEDFFDKFAIDFKKLKPGSTTKLLNILIRQIKGKAVDLSALKAERENYEISVWVSRLGEIGKGTMDSINTIKSECQARDIELRVETEDMKEQ